MASLTLENITKRFGRTSALSGVDLRVEDGEFCVLLGPSGCGKSTMLNIIAGLLPQDEGSVLLDDEQIDRLSPRERDVAMVFQNYALYPHMTVARNLSFGLRMRRLPPDVIHERVTETARLLGIEDLLDRKPRALSGGQQQRVAMGRALVRRPRLFLLDEPLSNLDARLRANVRIELKRLHRQIMGTVVYVTHDQVEAMTLGDRIVVMRRGMVHQIGSPDEIYSRPVDRFVATFIGTPEMNLFEGRLVSREGGIWFKGGDFSINLKGLDLPAGQSNVSVGIRPEDIQAGEGGASALRGRVEMTSNVGSEKYVHVSLGEENLSFRASKHTVYRPGEIIPLSVDPAKLHFFVEGRRIDPHVEKVE